jgi:putative transposase
MKKGSILLRCAVVGMSRDTYYQFPKRKAIRQQKDCMVVEALRDLAEKKRFKLGVRTLTMAYNRKHKKDNRCVNRKKVARLKREYDIPTKIRCRRKIPKPQQPKAQDYMVIPENIVNRQFCVIIPMRVTGTDVTYLWIPLLGVFAYLANVRDMATGEYLGWAVSFTNDQTLADAAVLDIECRHGSRIFHDLTIHADRGGTYTAEHFQVDILTSRGITPSMSRKGNCIDNAPTESGHGHLKDWFDFSECQTLTDITNEVDRVIHYFNNERPQWHRQKMTPVEYRNHLLTA